MKPILIVCAHDGLPVAQEFDRVLSAQERTVEITYGRPSLERLERARTGAEIVVLLWSARAPHTHYMSEWLSIDVARVIEIGLAPGWPSYPARRAPVIDFTKWNLTRGNAAWRNFTDRLDQIENGPAKTPPIIPAAIMLATGAAAAGVALFVRMHPPPAALAETAPQGVQIAQVASDLDGVGGPVRMEEPASYTEEPDVRLGPYTRARQLDTPVLDPLLEAELARPMRFRDPNLLTRVVDAVRAADLPLIGERDDSKP